MSKLNGLGKTHRERIFVVELKLQLCSPFHCEKFFLRKFRCLMKESSISSTVIKYLTLWLSRCFLWTIKINCRPLLIQIHFETNIFLSTKVIWEREKREFINKWPTSLLKNTAQLEKRDIFMENGNESKDVIGDSRKRYRYPWAEIGKYWPGREPIKFLSDCYQYSQW